jgi:hypothetical protein
VAKNVAPVLAVLESRLETDVVMIRLRRIDIPCEKISVIFPRRFTANAVACWLNVAQDPLLDCGREPLLIAGRLRTHLARAGNRASIVDLLEGAGFDHRAARFAEHQLKLGYILVCVHAEDETESALAWHIFKHSMAEMIVMAESSEEVASGEPMLEPWPAVA